jgi:bifunctional non-homologous end joining protein LigD
VTILELAGRSVELTTPDRVLWPRVGYTKQDLLDYYLRIAPVLLPHLADRPLTLGRFPHGVEARGFAQTECRDAPDWLRTVPIRLRNGEIRNYCVVEDEAGLAWLANRSVVELHPFLGLDRPHAVVFDLDPGEPADVVDCAEVALLLRERLGGDAVVKTSGSVGLHVFAATTAEYEETRAFARDVAEELERAQPDLVVSTTDRAARAGRVLVDWMQNASMRSTIAPYSLRAAPWPTASTPVAWEEVERAVAERRPELLTFLAGDVVERVARLGDLFRYPYGYGDAVQAFARTR